MEIYRKSYIFSILFLYCSDWVITIVLSSSSVILSSVTSIWLVEPVFFWTFNFNYCVLLKFPSGSCLHLLFLCWVFPFFHLFEAVCNCLLKHFYHGCFKILSDNSNTSVIVMLTSVECLFAFSLIWFLVWQVIFNRNLDIFVWCYETWSCLNLLFKLLDTEIRLLWHCFGGAWEGRAVVLPCYSQGEIEV